MSNSFSWNTTFKSIIIVDSELFSNKYKINISLTPHTANLKEQTQCFDRLKNLFEQVFANTITTWRDDKLYHILKKSSGNRFIELPKPPYDQIMAAVCFCKANSILDSKITINFIELSSWQGDGITYKVDKNSKELILLDTPNWFSKKYGKFDPWWLRADTATYDQELDKGIYTGHFSWDNNQIPVDKNHEYHAKIFEFNPKVLDGGKDKTKK
jgi:hypothetical protein|tara:strand:+ start:1984 stop:2622 length:639 start_codon:yes stop_codon:yes gene_type:complete